MAYYVPPSEKVVGHVPRVPHQIAPMSGCALHFRTLQGTLTDIIHRQVGDDTQRAVGA